MSEATMGVDDVLRTMRAVATLRDWSARVIKDATPDADGAVGFTCDSEVRAAEAFADLDKWLRTLNVGRSNPVR